MSITTTVPSTLMIGKIFQVVSRKHTYAVYYNNTGVYYNNMRQLKSMLNIPEPGIPQHQPETSQSLLDTIGAIFKLRHDIIDAIIKKE